MVRRIIILLTLAVAGCAGSHAAYTDHSRDPQAYAQDVKEMVGDHVKLARQAREPADMLAPIVSELEQLDERPVGEHRMFYETLLAAARDVMDACQRVDGRPPRLDYQLDQLLSLLDQLP